MPRFLVLLVALVACAGCSAADALNNVTPRSSRFYGNRTYAEDLGLKLDVYAPRHLEEKAPVIVFLFPGRWSIGGKQDFRFVAEGITSLGFIAVVPDYRQLPVGRYPDFLHDCARAVVWARHNIAAYGGDPDKLFLMGHSAGAYNAAMIALDEQYLQRAGGSRAWLRGMIGLSGPYDFPVDALPDIYEVFKNATPGASQPIDFVDGRNPPLLLLHGEDDWVVDVKNTRSLASKVAAAGGSVETVIYENLDHGLMVAALSPSVRFRSNPLEFIGSFVRRQSGTEG